MKFVQITDSKLGLMALSDEGDIYCLRPGVTFDGDYWRMPAPDAWIRVPGPEAKPESPDEVSGFPDIEWIVNDNAELGVKVDGVCYFLYKGRSFIYKNGTHDNGSQMYFRPVRKIEFGESAYPLNYDDLNKPGTVDLSDSDEWQPLPKSNHPDAIS